jgi:hypothetical protein
VILPRPAPPRRNETRDITHPCRVALNKLPGVRVFRNNVGSIPLPTGGRIAYGLAVGSADLVGWVNVKVAFARFFALETKQRGKKQTPSQLAWANTVRSMGGFACVVTSVDEALSAVARCRAGESE